MNSMDKNGTRRALRARRRRSRGTAFVETAIMLPFLLIVFSGIVYLGRLYLARQQALLTARSCAWRYAYNSCATLPPGCPKDIFIDKSDTQPDPALKDQINQAKATTQGQPSGSSSSNPPPNTNAFKDKTGGFVDDMVGFVLGEAVTATNVRTVPKPPVLQAASDKAPASYYLPCNTKEKKPIEMAIDLFKSLVPKL
jgi:hypothetical protein